MTVAHFAEVVEVTAAQALQVSQAIAARLGDQPPAGGLYHAEGPTTFGGWWWFNVWVTDEDAERFARDILEPALAQSHLRMQPVRRLDVTFETSSQRPTVAAE